MKQKKVLACMLSLAMMFTMFTMYFGVTSYATEQRSAGSDETAAVITADAVLLAANKGWQPKPTRTVKSASEFPITLKNGEILQINGPIEYTASAGVSPITLAEGASASIIINGSVTLRGADASGTTGATAAIKVPAGAKLTVYSAHDEELSVSAAASKDTLTVTGGNAASGSNGENAQHTKTPYTVIPGNYTAYRHRWYTGAGGNGGGGGAAAIGGNGGKGGNGGAKAESKAKPTFSNNAITRDGADDNSGAPGNNGNAGSKGETAGAVYILGRLNLNATGGNAAGGGNGGSGCEGLSNTVGRDMMIGGCGGGGGGGGGCAAPAIGAGGAGGSGGGSGGLLSSDCTNTVEGCGGGGGGGGWPNGGGGGGGGAECTNTENGNDNKSKGGEGGTGGNAGSVGGVGSTGTTTGTPDHGYDTKKHRYDAEPGEGGNGGNGLLGGGGRGGVGGTEKDDKYNAGDGGAGGGNVESTPWHTKGSLVLSTAGKLNLKSSLNYGNSYKYGDGQGGTTAVSITPDIVYDLMDCAVKADKEYTYTGAQIKPGVVVTYSAATDRDGSRVSHRDITISSGHYTVGYGENIHCPQGTVALVGTADANRSTAVADGSLVGAKNQTFVINKAELRSIGITVKSDNDPVRFDDYLGKSYPVEILLGNYTSTAQYDTNKNIGQIKLDFVPEDSTVWQGWFIVSWPEPNPKTYTVRTDYGVTEGGHYTFYAYKGGQFNPQIKLTGMNDFKDFTFDIYTATGKMINVDKPLITGTLSINPPHPRLPVTVTVPSDAGTVTYQWYLDGKKITGATGRTYTPKNSDIGKNLSVHVIPTDADSPYKNADETTIGNYISAHSYKNGFCTVCGEYEKPALNNGYYEIDNGGKMFWFAAYVNGISTHAEDAVSAHYNAKARLTGDISLHNPKDSGGTEWTPIGETSGSGSKAFTGVLDGGGHTISDLYITNVSVRTGLFGTTVNASIKNFTLKGDIKLSTGNSGSGSGVGSAVGSAESGTVISDIISYVNISNSAGTLVHVGGIAGELTSARITKCMFFGSINLLNSHDSIGGVVGYINNSDVGYCANHGAVKTASAGGYVGGIVGYLNNKDGKVHNCYNYGSVQNGGGNYCGAIIGWLRNSGAAANLTDNCYLTGSAASAFGTGSVSTAAAVPVKDKAAFASGEVCYLVNGKTSTGDTALWKQDIDNGNTPYDEYPEFDAAPVYYRSDGTYSNEAERISVTITWGAMEFDYHSGQWEPGTHEYVGGYWLVSETDGDKLTVQNNSNVALNVEISFTAEPSFSGYGLTGSFRGISSGTNRTESGQEVSARLVLNSSAPESIKDGGKKKIGEITVRITTIGGGN